MFRLSTDSQALWLELVPKAGKRAFLLVHLICHRSPEATYTACQ